MVYPLTFIGILFQPTNRSIKTKPILIIAGAKMAGTCCNSNRCAGAYICGGRGTWSSRSEFKQSIANEILLIWLKGSNGSLDPILTFYEPSNALWMPALLYTMRRQSFFVHPVLFPPSASTYQRLGMNLLFLNRLPKQDDMRGVPRRPSTLLLKAGSEGLAVMG